MGQCQTCRSTTVSDITCPMCRHGVMKGEWKMPCIVYTCQGCGKQIVGGSVFYPCMMDDKKYQVQIKEEKLSKKQLLAAAGYLKLPVLQFRKLSAENKMINRLFSLKEVMELLLLLKQNNVSCEVFPEKEYEDYWKCEKRCQ